MSVRAYWREIVVIATVVLLLASVVYVLYEDRRPPPDAPPPPPGAMDLLDVMAPGGFADQLRMSASFGILGHHAVDTWPGWNEACGYSAGSVSVDTRTVL